MAGTIQQIAELAEVSRGTVDRALNNRGRVNCEVAKRIEDIARDMGYVPKSRKKAAKASGMGYTDQDGNELIPCIYDYMGYDCLIEELEIEPPFSEGLMPVEREGKWGYVDETGDEVIPPVYEEAQYFSEGLASVRKNGKWDVIDQRGNTVLDFIYEDLDWSPSQGCVSAVQNGKSGWITLEGREIVPCVYDFISRIETSGLFIAEKDGKKAVLIKKEGLDSYRMKARKLI